MLTPRTECIVKHVHSKRVADIGTDHAYIPIHLIENNICSRVIATDISAGPVSSARKNIEKNNLSESIEVRLGSGLTPIEESECDECIIAGMGGCTIINILSEKTLSECKYILQPMNYQYELRSYLYSSGFKITEEDIAVEGFKVYNIICAEKSASSYEKELDLHIPPSLYSHKYINELKSKKKREFLKIKNGLKKSSSPDELLIEKYDTLLNELDKI